jgi:hypothetical protein
MKQQQNKTENPPENGANYVALAIACLSLAPELLLHDPRTFGIRSAGPRAFGTVLGMWVFALCYTIDNRMPLFALTALVALLAIVAHISALGRERRGEACHSRYNGRPWAVAIFPISEGRMKRTEPLLLVLSGWGLHHLNCPLGTFVITSGACYGLRVLLECMVTRTRALDFNDALAEQTVAMRAVNRLRRR